MIESLSKLIELFNTPALLVLTGEAIIILIIINIILVVLLTRKNGKTVKALNALVHEIKAKSEEQKKEMTELLLQPELLDPETIKKGMQDLASGQTQLYKDMIKAIRTQNEEDVVSLSNSVSGLVGSALKLGRESGEGCVDKEAQARLEEENENLAVTNENLSESKAELEDKLEKVEQEAEVLMNEYNSMMENVQSEDGSKDEDSSNDASSDGETAVEDSGIEMNDEIVDVSGGEEASNEKIVAQEEVEIEEEVSEDQELIDIASEMPVDDELLEGLSEDIDTASTTEEVMDDIAETPEDIADEILDGMMDDMSGEEAAPSSSENKEEAA